LPISTLKMKHVREERAGRLRLERAHELLSIEFKNKQMSLMNRERNRVKEERRIALLKVFGGGKKAPRKIV
jgi:hypothetical protein